MRAGQLRQDDGREHRHGHETQATPEPIRHPDAVEQEDEREPGGTSRQAGDDHNQPDIHLPAERRQRLEALGFDWDPVRTRWEKMSDRLARYKDRFGHCNVPANWLEDPHLAHWVTGQRQLGRRGRLPAEHRQRLDALGFMWGPLSAWQEKMFARLVQFKERAGHCNVPQKWPEDSQLANWVRVQRDLKKGGRLPPERRQRLDALGFTWDPLSERLEEMFTRLGRFKERFGHCNVPDKWEEDPQLANWIGRQRQLGKQGHLPGERRQRLDALGFDCDPKKAGWEEMFARLVQVKERAGHCNVPQKWLEDPQLGSWVGHQRELGKRGRPPAGFRQRLDGLGFEWDPRVALWEEMFTRLVQFKERAGHCNVSQKWREDPQLGTWVSVQRRVRKQDKLSRERIRRLAAIGFEWDPHAALWEEIFTRLVEFKRRFGHCNVPQQWPEDPQLARWVHKQRQSKKRDNASRERIRRLGEVGLVWEPKRAPGVTASQHGPCR